MLPAGIGLFLLCLIFPKLAGYAPLDALRALYGGVPLGRLTVQAGFFFTFSLLQYCGWLGLSCLLKNKTNLLPRWQSRGKLFAALWRFLLPTDLLFVLCAAAGTLAGLCGGVWSGALAGLRGCIPAGTLQELAEISVRGLIECIFLSGLQLFFLVRFGEERTAIAMTATAVGMTLISLSPVRLVWLAPAKTPFPAVSFATGVCLAIGAAGLGEKASLRDA
ncbi:MAG: hypothetical protein NC432_00360 [Roseburia sp.]|nr:hypothetical protein [Roseburia sp.]MCM1098361.1 hypothetical protein [Ruminococcus flavefaciens]